MHFKEVLSFEYVSSYYLVFAFVMKKNTDHCRIFGSVICPHGKVEILMARMLCRENDPTKLCGEKVIQNQWKTE